MATEELIVLLDAKTQKLDAKLRATEKRLDDFEGSTGKADKSLLSLSGTAKAAGAGLLKVATVVLAVNAAISAMVLASAKNRKELELLSKQAKVSTEDFQALAFSTSQFGINAEQIADISKDIADKIGEFSAAGTGAFQDYADVIKLTKEEAQQAAIEFQGLSSQEVLGKMVSEMEKAGATGDQMTFVLESMGSDLSRLQPLFANNSKELEKLKTRFKSVNDELKITDLQAEKLKEVSTSYQLMASQAGNAATSISATLAPVMDDFFNDVISVVPQATQAVIDFINSFLDAENITTQSAVLKELENSRIRIIDLQKEASKIESVNTSFMKDSGASQQQQLKTLGESIQAEKLRTEELSDQLRLLEAQKLSIEDAKTLQGGKIGGETETGGDGVGTGDQIEAIANRFRTEEELLVIKLENELLIIGNNDELKAQLENEFFDKAIERQLEFEDSKSKIDEEAISKKAKLEDKAGKAKISLENNIANNSVSLLNMIAGENKAAAIAALLIQKASALSANATATLSGSMLAYASQIIPGDPTSIIRAEAARDYTLGLGSLNAGLIVATGLGEAAGVLGGGSGGGGSSGGSSGGTQDQQQNFQQETSSLELTNSNSSGSQVTAVPFSTDSGDELMDVISKLLNERRAEGRN
jgi:hypothetical protein